MSDSEGPWFPLYIEELQQSIAGTTPAGLVAAVNLVVFYFENRRVPFDDAELFRITRISKKDWRKNKRILALLASDERRLAGICGIGRERGNLDDCHIDGGLQ